MDLLVFESREELWGAVAEKWQEIAGLAVSRRGRFCAALSGGKTPRGLYAMLAERNDLPWEKTDLFLVDERFVPMESEENNYRMIREALLDRAAFRPQSVHPIVTDTPSPEISADRYERGLRSFFGVLKGQRAVFDLILLGIGEDGHTASLFPGTPSLRERYRLSVAVRPKKETPPRVTLTLPVINSARNVIFMVSGRGKAAVLKKLVRCEEASLPAARVRPDAGTLLLFADKDAAGLLVQ